MCCFVLFESIVLLLWYCGCSVVLSIGVVLSVSFSVG